MTRDPLRADAPPILRKVVAELASAVASAPAGGLDAVEVADSIADRIDCNPALVDETIDSGRGRLWRLDHGVLRPLPASDRLAPCPAPQCGHLTKTGAPCPAHDERTPQ